MGGNRGLLEGLEIRQPESLKRTYMESYLIQMNNSLEETLEQRKLSSEPKVHGMLKTKQLVFKGSLGLG